MYRKFQSARASTDDSDPVRHYFCCLAQIQPPENDMLRLLLLTVSLYGALDGDEIAAFPVRHAGRH